MSSKPIGALANGFLSLLGLKNMGKNPDVLLDEVRATTDMTQWYLESNARNTLGFVTITDVLRGFAPLITVPAGELWFVHMLSVRLSLPALPGPVEAHGFAACINTPHPAARYIGDTFDLVIPAPTIINGAATVWAPSLRSVWAPPGSTMGSVGNISLPDNVGAYAWTLLAEVRYTPIPV